MIQEQIPQMPFTRWVKISSVDPIVGRPACRFYQQVGLVLLVAPLESHLGDHCVL